MFERDCMTCKMARGQAYLKPMAVLLTARAQCARGHLKNHTPGCCHGLCSDEIVEWLVHSLDEWRPKARACQKLEWQQPASTSSVSISIWQRHLIHTPVCTPPAHPHTPGTISAEEHTDTATPHPQTRWNNTGTFSTPPTPPRTTLNLACTPPQPTPTPIPPDTNTHTNPHPHTHTRTRIPGGAITGLGSPARPPLPMLPPCIRVCIGMGGGRLPRVVMAPLLVPEGAA